MYLFYWIAIQLRWLFDKFIILAISFMSEHLTLCWTCTKKESTSMLGSIQHLGFIGQNLHTMGS